MIHEERIKLMTRMAAYQQGEHKKNRSITSFFRSDYISLELLKSVICATASFAIFFAMYILYDFELFMKDIYQMDLFEFARNVIIIYLIVVAVFSVITYVVSLYRYNRALQSSKLYYANLKKLSHMYGEEE